MKKSICDYTLKEWYSKPFLEKLPVLTAPPKGWLLHELTPAPKGYVVCSLRDDPRMTAFIPKANLNIHTTERE